ncbi:unnamed protein product [Didymodactylos carnosus]|uniref:EGF-like domain-containing protein n=1 Tax=Didymodactylos carnosus TaxID=1234261 RepID=A0A814E5A1_9BILA|nr:unnamed protein product [Didymodactylos carnosus]CAF0967287.1 unnamed protein product [Didymodactylos carnosus]CAF3578066.1 unnamed protein product [Didymodactylos carnosus]CAF3740714.1 unnamed protein product [Didymodactylos carnosus]
MTWPILGEKQCSNENSIFQERKRISKKGYVGLCSAIWWIEWRQIQGSTVQGKKGDGGDGEGPLGAWQRWRYCSEGKWAMGFRQKVEPDKNQAGDTAMNALILICIYSDGSGYEEIYEIPGHWGDWSDPSSCCDDTAANDVRFQCTKSKQVITTYNGGHFGYWRPRVTCTVNIAICGFRLKWESKQGGVDDSAANGSEFACCHLRKLNIESFKPVAKGYPCEIHALSCRTNPCKNNAPCTQVGHNVSCNCKNTSYQGHFYDKSCYNGKSCINGGVCENGSCRCKEPYGGPHCETLLEADSTNLCNLWGDPHLLMFAQYFGAQADQYLCTGSGTFPLLFNKLINATITVSDDACIRVELDCFTDLRMSTGLCTRLLIGTSFQYEPAARRCRGYKNPAQLRLLNPTDEEKRISKLTDAICQAYIDEGTEAAKQLSLPVDSRNDKFLMEDVLDACIYDTCTSRDREIGASGIDVLLSEGIRFLMPKNDSDYLIYITRVAIEKETVLRKTAFRIEIVELMDSDNTSTIG